MKIKNKCLCVIVFFLVVSMCVFTAVPMTASAEDTKANEIYINCEEDLIELAQNCRLDTWSRGKTVVLKADISLEGEETVRIPTFGGTFDGGGHTISGVVISDSVSPAAFFGTLQEGAVVKNLKISGTVTPSGDAQTIGGIVGRNYGTISNCSFTGNVSGDRNVGGIAGINAASGTIQNCHTSGEMSGENMKGGIAGYNLGKITSCQNNISVNTVSVDPSLNLADIDVESILDASKITSVDTTDTSMDTGGIAGYSSGVIEYCTNNSTVGYQHIGYNVGGIVGRSCGYIRECENKAEVYGRKDVGGIAGQIEPYISRELSANTLSDLQQQLNSLSSMLDNVMNDASASIGTVTVRMNSIADYMNSAASAADTITTTGTIDGIVTGSGQIDNNGNITVSPPQIEIEKEESGENAGSRTEESNDTADSGEDSPEGGETADSGETPSENEGMAELPEVQVGITDGSVGGESSTTANGVVDASTQISMSTSLNNLSAAVYGMSDQMRQLNSELAGSSSAITEDMRAVNAQINTISNTVNELVLGIGGSDIMVDTSEENIDQVTCGKVAESKNTGVVYGDINVGGVTGAMAIEYEFDPEDDVTANLSQTQQNKYEIKAILQKCVNEGTVTSKRNNVGGICGRMDLGLIISCENYGDAESESGSYTGGIAGITGSTIRNSYAKCTLKGGKYVGGIVGSGVETSTDGSTSTVSGCYSYVSIPQYDQYVGAVSGGEEGNFQSDYFVSDVLGGINGISYSGQAEPIAYEALPFDKIPEEFGALTLTFVIEDEAVKKVSFDYGESFEEDVFPEIPSKEDCYAHWDKETLEDLHFDTVVTAVYSQYVTTLSSSEYRASGHPVFLVEGQFDEDNEITVSVKEDSEEEKGISLKNRFIEFTAIEKWNIEIPDDGLKTHRIRYLPPEEKTDNISIYVKKNGKWKGADAELIGSYETFEASGSHVEMVAISTFIVRVAEVVITLITVLIVVLIIFLLRKLVKKYFRNRNKAENADLDEDIADVTDIEEEDAGTAEHTDQVKKHSFRIRGKLKIWQVSLIIIVVIIASASVITGLYYGSGLKDDVDIYQILKKYSQEQELSMELSIQTEVGKKDSSLEVQIDRTNLDGRQITCIEHDGINLYYADNAVLFENGNAYKTGEFFPNYEELLEQTVKLYQYVDTKGKRSGDDLVYTITATEENAEALLQMLIPDAVSQLSGVQSVDVEVTASGEELSRISFSSNFVLDDTDKTQVVVQAELVPKDAEEEGQKRLQIPQAVKDAVTGGEYAASSVLTEDIFRLMSAWGELNSREALAADVTLTADCKPLSLSEKLEMFCATENETTITCLKKSGLEVYFTEEAICDKSGNKMEFDELPLAQSADLLEIAYQFCMNADVDCSEDVYTIALDEEGMKCVAAAIAPETKDMNLNFGVGSIQITLEDETIQSIRFSCDGTVKTAIADVPMALSGELEFCEGESDFTVPEKVKEALAK